MLFKKQFEQYQVGDVHLGNGTIQFQSIKLNVFSYAVDGVLIDTGAQSLLQHFKSYFESVDVEQVVITHYHEDHTGGAKYMQNTYGYPVYMNKTKIDYCNKRADYPLYRKLFWGNRAAFKALPLGKTFKSRHALWDVINTPGHAIDHLAFLNRETGQLFTGDLYVTPKTKVILREEDVPTIINSLQEVLQYDFNEVFCCHAGYIKNGRKALMNKLEYLLALEYKVQKLHKEGNSKTEIQAKLFKKKYPITRVSLGEWDSKHIISTILSNGKVI